MGSLSKSHSQEEFLDWFKTAYAKKDLSKKEEQAIFEELKQLIHSLGSIVSEFDLLTHISKDKNIQNHIHFYLELSYFFKKHR